MAALDVETSAHLEVGLLIIELLVRVFFTLQLHPVALIIIPVNVGMLTELLAVLAQHVGVVRLLLLALAEVEQILLLIIINLL